MINWQKIESIAIYNQRPDSQLHLLQHCAHQYLWVVFIFTSDYMRSVRSMWLVICSSVNLLCTESALPYLYLSYEGLSKYRPLEKGVIPFLFEELFAIYCYYNYVFVLEIGLATWSFTSLLTLLVKT